MSAIQIKQETKTILNFNDKLSKRNIYNSFKEIDFVSSYYSDEDKPKCLVLVNNDINVGMYKIRVSLLDILSDNKKLYQHKNFKIAIFENSNKLKKEINLKKDLRFKFYKWGQANDAWHLSIKDLVNVIYLCSKLDDLKSYL